MNQLLAMRTFVRVAETGSFTRAADLMVLPRSTVSKLISDLEQHLDVKLLNRTTREVSVTVDGLDYYDQASRLLAEIEALDGNIKRKKSSPSGHLRIDAPSIFANNLLIPALPKFHQQYPDITIALGIGDRSVNIVGEGVDCVIRAGELGDMSMVGRRLTALKYRTCASPSYLNQKGMPAHPTDIERKHTRLGYFFAATGKPLPLIFERGTERFEMSDSSFSANDGNGLLELMLAGLGIGQHFQRCVQHHIDAGRLVPILEDWTQPDMTFHVIYPPNQHQTDRLKVFVEWLLDNFEESQAANRKPALKTGTPRF